jgi:hypothetical protein
MVLQESLFFQLLEKAGFRPHHLYYWHYFSVRLAIYTTIRTTKGKQPVETIAGPAKKAVLSTIGEGGTDSMWVGKVASQRTQS